MRYEVTLTENANFDLEEIYNYIAIYDAPSKADYELDGMEDVIKSLVTFPERGSYPGELLDLGIREYRQTFFKPYRVIYRIIGSIVYVQLISDGRREMVSLLARRLLGLQ
jgi:toxin ParE1/3/4